MFASISGQMALSSHFGPHLPLLFNYTKFVQLILRKIITRCHAIAKTTARCAQYIMSALKIVCKHKSSRRLRKNLHITIVSLFGGEIIFEYSNKCDHGT